LLEFKAQICSILSQLTSLPGDEVESLLEIPPEAELGEYAFPCFVLARQMKKAPPEIARELASRITPTALLEKAHPVGPYLNFHIRRSGLIRGLLPAILEGRGTERAAQEGRGKTVVIDFSAPNIAKPFGVGHLRSTVIGHALYRIYQELGYQAVGINHLGDWGTQFGKLIVAFRRWGENERLQEDPVQYLYHLYVRFHQEAAGDEALEEEARQWFLSLEKDHPEALALWERFRQLSLQEFKRIYAYLGIEFDQYQGESFYNTMLEQTLQLAREKGLAKESQGALVADLEPHGLPPCLLQKKDGATLYITRDLAAAIYRQQQYRFDKLLYVVGAEQTLHFRQLFKMLELMDFAWAKNCVHVPFGLIHFKDGRMSTRQGKVIFLEDVIQRAVELAQRIIEEKNPGLQEKEKAARMVGLGAVIFGDLVNDRVKDIEFDWDKVLDFSGETAPYIQYSHARICSILRKVSRGAAPEQAAELGLLTAPEEEQLVLTLARFEEQIMRAAADYRPSYLAHYLVNLARDFNRFYHSCPVLTAEENIMEARLVLIDAVRVTLAHGLELLGIEAPEKM